MESDIANGDRDDYIRGMDRRLIILETRFDTILPTLATKADLANLKAELMIEMHKLSASMHKWLAAMCIALLIGFGGLSLTMLSLINSLPQLIQQAAAQQTR
jgi:hypothetical protein